MERWADGCVLPVHRCVDTRGSPGILQARDLRVVDETFGISSQPALLVRQYCMVINLKPVRSIILPGKVLLFPRVGADGELKVGSLVPLPQLPYCCSRCSVVQCGAAPAGLSLSP